MIYDEHISILEDLEYTLRTLMPDPEKTEICNSLNIAISTMRKYEKIEVIVKHENEYSFLRELDEIQKVVFN